MSGSCKAKVPETVVNEIRVPETKIETVQKGTIACTLPMKSINASVMLIYYPNHEAMGFVQNKLDWITRLGYIHMSSLEDVPFGFVFAIMLNAAVPLFDCG